MPPMPPPPPPLKLPNARLPPPPWALLLESVTLLAETLARLATKIAPPSPAPPPPPNSAAIAAPRLGVSDHKVLDGDSDRDLRRRAGRPRADEQAAELVVARERVVVADDGDVGLHRRQVGRERDVRRESDGVTATGIGDGGAQAGVTVDVEIRGLGGPPASSATASAPVSAVLASSPAPRARAGSAPHRPEAFRRCQCTT